jgi:hypothetical protein
MLKRYFLYLLRWQLSTPILAVCVTLLSSLGNVLATVIANLAGGLMFFWIDKLIFSRKRTLPVWSVCPEAIYVDCGHTGRGYRLVESVRYDHINDINPQYRCESCSIKKAEKLSEKGVPVS